MNRDPSASLPRADTELAGRRNPFVARPQARISSGPFVAALFVLCLGVAAAVAGLPGILPIGLATAAAIVTWKGKSR